MTDVASSLRAQSLPSELADALSDAVSWEFDLPSDYAYSRAERLLRELGNVSASANPIDIAVAEDGSIHLGMSVAGLYHDVRIDPDGRRLSLGLIDYPKRCVAGPAEEMEEAEILARLERAAAA